MAKAVADYCNDTVPNVFEYAAIHVFTIVTLLSDKGRTLK